MRGINFLVIFSALLLVEFAAPQASIRTANLQILENPITHKRVYFTNPKTNESFVNQGFTISRSTGYGVVDSNIRALKPDVATGCPDLVKLSLARDENGNARLASPDDLKQMASNWTLINELGYVAPTAGYCGSSEIAMIEMYSEKLQTYWYVLTDKEYQSVQMDDQGHEFMPTKVIGFIYDFSEPDFDWLLTGDAPWIDVSARTPFTDYLTKSNNRIVKMRIIRKLIKGDMVSHVTTSKRIAELQANGYIIDPKFPNKYALFDENTVNDEIRKACHSYMETVHQYRNKTSGEIRLHSSSSYYGQIGDDEEQLEIAGYVFNSWLSTCTNSITPLMLTFINEKGQRTVTIGERMANRYRHDPKWEFVENLGYPTYGVFKFIYSE